MALAAGFDPARIHMHGNNKSGRTSSAMHSTAGVGHVFPISSTEMEPSVSCEPLPRGRRDPDPGDPGVTRSTRATCRRGSSTPSSASDSPTASRPARSRRAPDSTNLPVVRASRPHRLPILRARPYVKPIRGDRRPRRPGLPFELGRGLGIASVTPTSHPDRRINQVKVLLRRVAVWRRRSWWSRAAPWLEMRGSPLTGWDGQIDWGADLGRPRPWMSAIRPMLYGSRF